jgi:RNA polymerase sigma-70 factor (ECF subfamily)
MEARGPEPACEELARAAQAGSREAYGALVLRHEGSLVRFLRGRAANQADAEELAQEAFLRGWRKLEQYDPSYRFSTWLFTLARNLAISRARRRRAEPEGEESLAAVPVHASPPLLAARREESEGLWSLAERVLTREQYEALWLRYGEDLAAEEIGAILGKRAVAVRVLLFRAREQLGGHLERAAARASRQEGEVLVSPREVWS